MRTNFNIKNRGRQRGIFTKSTVVIILFALTITLLQIVNSNPFGGLFHSVIRPIMVIELSAKGKIDQFFELLRSKQSLVEKNIELQNKLKELQPSLYTIAVLRKENTELKTLFNRDTTDNVILASILVKPPVSLYDTLIIDVGKRQGVSEGDLVRVHTDFIVGTIVEVYRQTALVVLFSSPGRETDVTLGDEHLLVTAHGRGGGNFETRLPRGVEVALGDIVTLPDFSSKVFAVVERVIATPADQFQIILFKNPVNMAEVMWVEILRSGT